MARILAIDYGKKRSGIAVTDPLQLIASGLTTVNTNDLLHFLKDYSASEEIVVFVIGYPTQMDGKTSESEAFIKAFISQLVKAFPNIPIKRIDERFTSKMAVRTMISSGLPKKKRRDKTLLDEISATLILQTYLNQKEAK